MARDFDDYKVPPLNEEDCEKSATALRAVLGHGSGRLPHIMEVLQRARERIPELKDFELRPCPDEFMGRADAYAKHDEREIVARLSLCQNAIDDEDNARYVLLHELNHLIFHPGPRKFRIIGGNTKEEYIHDHESAEWQADRITRAMFMPKEMVKQAKSPIDLARAAGVPLKEAVARIRDLEPAEGKEPPPEFAQSFARLRAVSEAQSRSLGLLSSRRSPKKEELWSKLPTIPGEDPAKSRRCGRFRVLWEEFGRTSECGWYIQEGRIVSFFELAVFGKE